MEIKYKNGKFKFQWSHFFSEMDRGSDLGPLRISAKSHFASIDDFHFHNILKMVIFKAIFATH